MIRKKLAALLALTICLTALHTGLKPYYASEARQEQKEELLEEAEAQMAEGGYAPGEAIVTFDAVGKTPLTREGTASFDRKIQIEGVYEFDGTQADRSQYVVHLISDEYTTEELMEKALDFYYVDHVGANSYRKLYTDPYTDYQWYLDGTTRTRTTDSEGVRYSQLTATTGDTPVIAVVDTGVDYQHEDLKSQMWVNPYPQTLEGVYGYDFAESDDDPMDTYGHGTHVAGIAAAASDNETGITGLSSARIMALKVCQDDSAYLVDSAIIAAFSYIVKAMEAGVNIVAVNCSWGGNYDSTGAINRAIDEIGQRGALTVFAAGNDGVDQDTNGNKMTPYDLDSPYKVVVGASDESDAAAYFSDYGKTSVDIFAPGTDMLSAYTQKRFLPQVVDASTRRRTCLYYNSFSEDPSNVMIGSQSYQDVYTAAQIGLASVYSTQAQFVTDSYNSYEKLLVSRDDFFPSKNSADMENVGSIYVDVTELNLDPAATYEVSFLEGSGVGDEIVWEDVHLKSTQTDSRFIKKDGRTYFRLVGLQIGMGSFGRTQTLLIDEIAISTANLDTSEYLPYAITNGSSMAAPVVSAATAILKSANPSMSGQRLRQALMQSVRKVDALENLCVQGGIIDFAKLANYASDIRISRRKLTVSYAKNKTIQLHASVLPQTAANQRVRWKVSNPDYALVDSNGRVRLKKAAIGHRVWVAAVTMDGSSLKAKCRIRVKK